MGEITNGIEETKEWGGAKQIYHLNERNGATELNVQLDSVPEFEQYFSQTFPKAFQILKRISEQ